MTHWPGNNGYSGQPEEPHLQSHDNGPGGPSASGGYPTLQPHSQVSTSNMFQQAVADRLHHNYSNLAQTGPQGLPLSQTSLNVASFNPSTSQAAFAYGSRNSQHAASGSQHQHEAFNIGSAPNADAYPNYHTSCLQDFAGDSYPILSQLEPSQPGVAVPQTFQLQDPVGGSYPTLGSYLQIPTGSASHQAAGNRLDHDSFAQNAPRELPLFPSSLDPTSFDRSTGQAGSAYDSRNPQHAIGIQDQHGAFDIGQDTHDGFIPQNIPQGLAHFPTDLNPTCFEPSMSQDQSSSSALGAYCPNDPDSLYSEDYIAMLGQKRPSYRKISHPYKGVPFVRSDTPPPSALSQSTRKTSTLQVESAVIDRVKEDASRFLNLSLFQSSLYPSLTEVDKFATAALNRAIGEHPKNVTELKAWKLRPKGQKFLSRLKGNIRKLHKDCSQGCAWGLVTGTYDLSLQLLFANTNEIALSRSRHVLALLSNNDYLDIVVQRVMSDGQLKSFRVPFANNCVIVMTEYILVDLGCRCYLSLDKPNWALGLRNTILLAATICKWKIRECSKNGWFQITDFHTSENEASYTELKGRMSSLLGSELEEFYGLLSCLRDLLLTLPVC